MKELKKRNQYDYDKKAYDHLHLQVPKGMKEQLQRVAKEKGHKSLNAYTKALYEADSGLSFDIRRGESEEE